MNLEQWEQQGYKDPEPSEQGLITKLKACEASSWNLNSALAAFVAHNPDCRYSVHIDHRFNNCGHSVHEFRLSYSRKLNQVIPLLKEYINSLLHDIKEHIPLVEIAKMDADFIGMKYKITIKRDF